MDGGDLHEGNGSHYSKGVAGFGDNQHGH